MKMRKKAVLYFFIFLVLLLVPLIVKSQYWIHVLIMSGIFIIQALALNLVYGYIGQLSLGHQAFWGIGGYASALVSLRLGFPFWASLLFAGAFAALIGTFIGLLTLRLKGHFFVIITICFANIIYIVCLNWISLTGGPMGITGIPMPRIDFGFFSFSFSSKTHYYWLILPLVLATVYIIWRLVNSRVGRAWIAIRESEDVASSVGIDAFYYKTIAFVISTFFAGVAGGFYAHYVTFISPEMFNFSYVIMMVIMVIVGGKGTIGGPIIGGFIFTLISEQLRMAREYRMPIIAIILGVAIIYMPEGIYPHIISLARRWQLKGLFKKITSLNAGSFIFK